MSESIPQLAADNVIGYVVYPLLAQLGISQARYSIVLIQALGGLGGRFYVPFDKGAIQRFGYFIGQHRLACARLAFNQERPLQGDGSIDRNH